MSPYGDPNGVLPAPLRQASQFIQEVVGRLGDARFTAEGADGRVVATVDGSGRLHQVDISPVAIRILDNITLGEEVTNAINAARATARQAYDDAIGTVSILGLSLAELRGGDREAIKTKLRQMAERGVQRG
jgi:DNA-binding protein YbaB